MSNDKNERRRLAKLILIVAVVVLSVVIAKVTETSLQEPANDGFIDTVKPPKITQSDGELILTMLDVGQADSFLFEYEGERALIDCGTRATGKDVVKYLKDNGITYLDYVFGTHLHDDHMGGMYDVITNIKVGKVIIPEIQVGDVTSNWYIKLINELNQGDYEVQYPKVGDEFYLQDVVMKVIAQLDNPKGNTNNYSTVIKVTIGEMDILMTGDAEKDLEEKILQSGQDISAEILKVGHHGSDTSTSDEFLDAVNPEYALISSKIGNKYEHPTKVIMDKLKERDIKVYRTDESGHVVVTITATDINFSCEPGDYLSGKQLEEREQK